MNFYELPLWYKHACESIVSLREASYIELLTDIDNSLTGYFNGLLYGGVITNLEYIRFCQVKKNAYELRHKELRPCINY